MFLKLHFKGGIVTKQLLASFLVWNGMEQRKGRIWHTLHMRSASGVYGEMREYAEGVYREMQRNTEGVYREMQRKMTCTWCTQLQLFMTMLLANGGLQNLHL